MTTVEPPLTWDPPGKGDWRGLHDHFTRPVTPEYQRLLAKGMEAGEAESFARYGLPVRTILCRFVNGRVYIAAAPLVGPATAAVPPAPLLWLACRVVPAFRRRAAIARSAVAGRIWLQEAAHWYEVERPAWQARGAELESVDPARLSDADLADHLRLVRQAADDGYRTHFRLHGPDLLPLGMLLARGEDWGIDGGVMLGLLAGSSPASTGATPLPAWRLVTGYDLDSRAAAELPMLAALAPWSGGRTAAPERDAVRALVPTADHDEFDQLVDDARSVCDLRDDNGIWAAAWPAGLLRRAMLEAGRRLVHRGLLLEPSHGVEVTVAELTSLLGDEPAVVSAAQVAERARRRSAAVPPPAALGSAVDLPVSALPVAMRTMVRALLAVRDHGSVDTTGREPLDGDGIGDAVAVGRAVLVDDATGDALARFEPGDVLVTRGTTPAFNVLLACAGAVVTEEGGQLSHAAVVARELGLPGIIGAAGAMTRIPDGALVEVDPVAGRVRVLSGAPDPGPP